MRDADIRVQATRTWRSIYHHGYGHNPFDEMVRSTYKDTRSELLQKVSSFIQQPTNELPTIILLVYVILGHHYEHVGLMLSLQAMHLLDHGEYFVVGVDIEQYDAQRPENYLRGLLQDTTDPEMVTAFRSYLGIVPSAHVHFNRFAALVSTFVRL